MQPTKERLVGHWWPSPGEVLIQVVVGIDQPGGDKLICRIDHPIGFRGRGRGISEFADQSIGDRDPTARYLTAIGIDGCDEACVGK